MKRRAFVAGVAAVGAATLGGSRQLLGGVQVPGRQVRRLDIGWRFMHEDVSGAELPGLDDAAWQSATLPHTARVEALVTGVAGSPDAQWQGICWYRLRLRLAEAGERVLLRFEGAMNIADVWLDGRRVGGHLGGYLPFVLDISKHGRPGGEYLLAVRLDNRDNPITGPKPLAQLDFNMYHGLYRPVYLIQTDRLHITDPLLADVPASGGVFVSYPRVAREFATVRVQVHVRNDRPQPGEFRVRVALRDRDGDVVASATSPPMTLAPGAVSEVVQEIAVTNPQLWSPASPALYALDCEVVTDARTVDAHSQRIGIRRIDVSRDGFRVNGQLMFLRGTNRHQEYPYIGYAVSDAAQYRDARKIKEAGFDYVRLSHYAHAPAFMDACDELGLVVMNCIPGWQYFNPEPAFVELLYRNCRDLIRRDRNHPCVVMWEVALNESAVPTKIVARMHAIAHEEYPGDQCVTAGWVNGYDVFLDARQHGGCRHGREKPCLVSEYGDWEYYAMNAGLDQGSWQNLSPAESNSRQLRWQGERAQLQQATNFQEAHNDNLGTVAFGDGLWVMYDYNRGYAPDIESSGCMDLFRLPKYSYHFFRSQRQPSEHLQGGGGGPMAFIASDWTPASASDVRVFSNCDEVALLLNGRLLARQRPNHDRTSSHLAHAPFTFATGGFRPGTLVAVGYLAGRPAARHLVRTPDSPRRLTLAFDFAGRERDRAHQDTILCHASLRDAHGTVVPDAWENIAFGSSGTASLIGANPFSTDAGIASIVVQSVPGDRPGAVHAVAILATGESTRIVAASAAFDGSPPAQQICYTTDGSAPGPRSARYRGAITSVPRLRAGLLVNGEIVTSLDANTPRFRIPRNAPPDRRDPFRR